MEDLLAYLEEIIYSESSGENGWEVDYNVGIPNCSPIAMYLIVRIRDRFLSLDLLCDVLVGRYDNKFWASPRDVCHQQAAAKQANMALFPNQVRIPMQSMPILLNFVFTVDRNDTIMTQKQKHGSIRETAYHWASCSHRNSKQSWQATLMFHSDK